MVSRSNFAKALENYAANLKNDMGFTALEGFSNPEGATVNLRVDHKGRLIVTKAETFADDVVVLEMKLKVAKNEQRQAAGTISAQEKEIEDLTKQLKAETVVLEETETVEASNCVGTENCIGANASDCISQDGHCPTFTQEELDKIKPKKKRRTKK